MALWLAAAIVLIAVGVMPSGAQAHGRHAHGEARAVSASLASIAIRSTAEAAGPRAIASDAVTVRTRVAVSARIIGADLCDGSCGRAGCRGAGSCCTGAGLAPDAADAAAPRGPRDRALARALPARTDVVPEALPEPPRFHA
ncbi:hypothetical protein [Methylobacterium sp. J-068]|uniref:hypothetical protein n=1 Tax=Methylobacterium sp. J-068 TaxID=2836649 RepID=UPI001FB9808F|nr:hypothetical protein [Methylobacterium sp. J-068]MCJ2036184.1 hypothetical protein [Methylobacterium sp. J-068]